MNDCLPCGRAWFAPVLALLLLAGCDRRPAPALPPDTTALGAGAMTVGGSCGFQADEALQRINAARAAGRRCGGRAMPPAPPLHWNAQLAAAALGHSRDMAQHNYFEHRSPGGMTVRDRVTASHYKARGDLGENIAGGNRTVAEAVQGWLDSPQHCENLMDAGFDDVAVACVAQPGTRFGTYWTMVLGRR
jgi:uncharacterized protein YkwD